VQQLKTRIAGESENSMQSRVARRYPLTELVTFVCKGKGPPFSPIAGVTENVSSTGILFLTEETIEVGSAISLTLYIPSRDPTRTIMLRAEGTVLRVERAAEKSRVAAEIRFQDDLEGRFDATRSPQ
jgi:PilZ domain